MKYLVYTYLTLIGNFYTTTHPVITPAYIYQKCITYNISNPEVVTTQSVLETGWYKSNLSIVNNNFFGFYYKGEFKKFESLDDCLKYYKRWQDKHYNGSEDYYAFLECLYKTPSKSCVRYAEDLEYTTKLKRLQKEISFK